MIARRFCTSNGKKNISEMLKADFKKYFTMLPNVDMIENLKKEYKKEKEIMGEEKFRSELFKVIGISTGIATTIPSVIACEMTLAPTIFIGTLTIGCGGMIGGFLGSMVSDAVEIYKESLPKQSSPIIYKIGNVIIAAGVIAGIVVYFR